MISRLLTTFLLSSLLLPPRCISERPLFAARLIYHASIYSPYFNATATADDHATRDMEISDARIKRVPSTGLSDYISSLPPVETSIIAQPPTPLFLVELQIGEPPFLQLLAFDTGSSLLWLHCAGWLSYIPSKSSTYQEIPCPSYLCTLYSGKCTSRGLCEYEMKYEAGFFRGTLARESFRFFTKRTNSSINDAVFACKEDTNIDMMGDEAQGVMGLGMQPISLMTQKGYSQFSYCIGNLSDPNYTDNVLIINGDPLIESQFTPLFIVKDRYEVKLERISVGGKFLDIVMPQDQSGLAIFDTGASISLLIETAYLELEDAVVEIVGGFLTRSYRFPGKLCYEGMLHRDLYWFPTVAFYFRGDTAMEFGYENLFQQRSSNVICLGVENAAKRGWTESLIGANLQQYFYVAYNLQRKRVHLERMDCEVLWD